jgi:teichuronic acid biosynthesis glycosyltransferase TuaC
VKVLFVSNLFPDTTDPVRGRINATLLRKLSGRVDVRVVGLRPVIPFLNRGRSRLKPCPEDEALRPVYRGVSYVPKIGGAINHRLLAADVTATLVGMRREFPYDIVLGSWIYPDVCGLARVLRYSRGFSVPLVGIAQGSDVHQYLGMRFRKELIVETLNEIPATITRSRDLAERLKDAGVDEGRLHPIYNGVDTDVFRRADRGEARAALGWKADPAVLLYVGNLLPIKNPVLLVRAHARLAAEHKTSPPRLVMIGAGPLRDQIIGEARAAGTADLVELVGRKPAVDVARHMQAADVLCVPSDNEGVPNVAFEAMACGLPIVATRVGGIPEVVDRAELGDLIAAGDEIGMVAALNSHLKEGRSRDRIAAHALQFSWDATVDAYVKVLQDARAATP